MRIKLESIPVADQEAALAFYTAKLGFVIKHDAQMGGGRILTLVAPDDQDGAQLMLEPAGHHEPTMNYKKALFEGGVPQTAFEVDDTRAEHARLTDLGVRFTMEPTEMTHPIIGVQVLAVFDDTCGNLIMIYDRPETRAGPTA